MRRALAVPVGKRRTAVPSGDEDPLPRTATTAKAHATSKATKHNVEKGCFAQLIQLALNSLVDICAFLTSCISDLNVVLTSYNNDVRLLVSWTEMLAHLNGYRNPYVCAQLLPAFLEPEDYEYKKDTSGSVKELVGEEGEIPNNISHTPSILQRIDVLCFIKIF